MHDIAVADTHALIWYAQGRLKKLGGEARRLFERADRGHAVIYLPTLSLAELGESVRAGKAALPGGLSGWMEALLSSRSFFTMDLTWEIVLRAQSLYAIPERGDRLIAATAAHLGYPLITRDPEITAAAGVEVIW